ncbi:MAG: hypothetical protein RML95_12000 [Anaerolineae bacterium]|nr:hypothetical protein [Anaerolineae bacterium]MDW8300046.1 hypothetical protein [Anaerolineae bacterium]
MANEELSKLLLEARVAVAAGDKPKARQLLEQALTIDDSNVQAWLLMARAVDTPRERRICYENVLDIDPNNAEARRALESLKPSPPSSATLSTPSTSMAQRAPAQPPIKPPAKPAGTTSRGTAEAWRSQRRSNALNPFAIAIVVVSALALLVGVLLLTNPAGLVSTATPTRIGAAPAPTATSTPTPTLPIVIVTVQPNPFSIPPTWTPSPTPTPLPTETPAPTLPPLSSYTLLYVREVDGLPALFSSRGDGSDARRLTRAGEPFTFPAWSSDGTRIAYTALVNGREQIFVAKADGSDAKMALEMPNTRARAVAWSPDDKAIAFSSNDVEVDDIYIYRFGEPSVQRITDGRGIETDPAWSPDGTKIAYAADPTGRGGSLQIFVRDLTRQGREATIQLTSGGQNFSPVWSPDGTQIAYVSSQGRGSRIFVMRADGSNKRQITFGDGSAENRDPSWSPDGRYIFFSSTRNGGVLNIFSMTPDGGNVTQITNFPENTYAPKVRPVARERSTN